MTEVIGPRRKEDLLRLIYQIGILPHCLLNTYLDFYLFIGTSLGLRQRGFFWQWVMANAETHNWSVLRPRNCSALGSKHLYHHLQDLGNVTEEGSQKDMTAKGWGRLLPTVASGHDLMGVPMNSLQLWLPEQICAGMDQSTF